MTRAVVFAYHNVGVRCLEVLLARGIDVPLVVTHADDPRETRWFDSVAATAAGRGIDTMAPENPNAADRLLLRIDSKLQILRDFPGIGTLRDDIRPGFRMLVEGNYLLLYEYDPATDTVELITVVDGRRDLSAIS